MISVVRLAATPGIEDEAAAALTALAWIVTLDRVGIPSYDELVLVANAQRLRAADEVPADGVRGAAARRRSPLVPRHHHGDRALQPPGLTETAQVSSASGISGA